MIEPGRYPTPQEVAALIRRAHRLRRQAIALMFSHAAARCLRAGVVLRRRLAVRTLRFARNFGEELRLMS